MIALSKLLIAVPALIALAVPAMAQESEAAATAAEPKINTVIVFGDDTCPESSDDQINVCAILVEGDRYRIPEVLRDVPNDPRKEAWANRVLAYKYVGAEGTMSCSATGAGGFTGCGLKEIDAAYAEKDQDPGLAFGRMIAAERKKRLAMIDAEAEEVEKRVVQFEKERAEREEREAQAAAGQGADDGALPEPK
ncbi:hypothetical protein [Sphingorhabdus sp.]|jgi:hypothetical protein|uniref:hypothetical protein n=1 Tax=Sphingorhabdus sp. TaxID=1902408 RepID=UPI003BAF4A7F|nr:hypothetical protein [Sphingomonadales bacterium]MBL0021345.1 hypothetical protein [Sphingomonadales bacterium]